MDDEMLVNDCKCGSSDTSVKVSWEKGEIKYTISCGSCGCFCSAKQGLRLLDVQKPQKKQPIDVVDMLDSISNWNSLTE